LHFDDRYKSQPLCSGSFAPLLAHLTHELAHRGDLARRAFLRPRFKAFGGVFHVDEEMWVLPHVAALLQSGPDALENAEELATGFEEEVFVQETIIEQGTGLLQ
jgi:hypothetical protein